MATGVNWLENPEFASVIRIAAGVASDILHDMFKLAGLTEEQADELLYDMGRVPLPDTSEQAIAALCCRLQDALADGAEVKLFSSTTSSKSNWTEMTTSCLGIAAHYYTVWPLKGALTSL